MKNTKKSLFTSCVALLLCFSMLLGTTWAWFTDEVISSGNRIVSGSLKVDLLHLVGEDWISLKEEPEHKVFDYDLWEPGYTQVETLKIKNIGNLALSYQLIVGTEVGTEKLGAKGESLADVIDVYVIDGKSTAENFDAVADNWTKLGTLSEFMRSGNGLLRGYMLPAGATDAQSGEDIGERTVSFALHMQEGAGNEYQELSLGDVYLTLLASQYTYENDSFGKDYDSEAGFPTFNGDYTVSAPVEVDENNKVVNEVTLTSADGAVSAVIPVGTLLEEGVTSVTLTVTTLDKTASNVELTENQVMNSVDVHVSGIADGNTVPVLVSVQKLLAPGLNMGNYQLYHVESGVTNEMSLTDTPDVHNDYSYDPATGDVTMALASFSEVCLLTDVVATWEGYFNYSWYNASKTELTIANADQLAGFGAIVGGMAENIEQDSFTGKTITLISDINLGDKDNAKEGLIFHPIGYYYTDDNNVDGITGDYYSTVNSFEGTFDGNGHTIANFYQNTWEMKGDYDGTYYNDAMGLFGYVYNGTVKNLTVDHFSSDGEFTPTGCVAAYAAGDAKFENIAITNCNPRVYNTGNGGIIGIAGSTGTDDYSHITLTNITVDNSNKISALWGSWDVACGGLVGMYRGNVDGDGSATGDTIKFTNCHVAAQIDVYNDVCANYQYYAYRYAGMIIGSVRHNKTEDGHSYPDMTGITADDCTVHFGDWNDYYYCELVANSLASYTHDYQFSRLEQVDSVDVTQKTVTVDGATTAIPTSGRYNYVVVKRIDANGAYIHGSGDDYAECYHFVNGVQHKHDVEDSDNTEIYETVNGESVLVENNQHIYLEFNNLVTGYGWGVTSKGLTDFEGMIVLDEVYKGEAVTKFETKFTGDFLYRVGNSGAVSLGTLFKAIDEEKYPIADSGAHVKVEALNANMTVGGTFTKTTTGNWEDGKIQFTGTGVVKVTIQDYIYCTPTELYLEVVDATNITSVTAGTGKNFVLLQDVTYNGTYLYYKNSTLYGNGFTIDITGADHSDLKDSSDTNSNKSAYCNIWMVDSRFDNVQIIGSVYPEVGMTADSDYGNAAIRTEGECYITNSYISNCRVPLRVQGNTTLIDTVVDGGRYANIEVRSGKLTLDGATTINTVRKGSDGTTDVIGFGIVIHSEAANASIAVVGDGLKQYNWAGENKHKDILSGDTYLSNAYKLIFNANNSDSIYFDYNDDRYVNTGILCLCADMNKDVVTGLDDRYYQEVSGYDAWVLTYDNNKHSEWFDESIDVDSVEVDSKQYPVLPNYSGNDAQTIEFTKGETYDFDTSVLTAEKYGQTLTVSSVVMNGTTYNYGDKITMTEGGVYEIVYTVVDPYNYSADATSTTTVEHTVSITVTAIAKDAEILAPKFTFIDQNDNKYESTTVKVGDKTYVMPNVTVADSTTNSMDDINIGSASISGTTVYFPVATGYTVRSGSNFNRYYPLFNGINITDYTIAGDTTGTTYTTSGNYTSLVGSSGTKFIIPANGGQTNCGDYVKSNGQAGNAAGNSDSGWQGAGYSTTYAGTYLKSGNTSASSGADSNGYERIVWVEYCFNAGNGDVYYYRIGYHCNKVATQSTCVTPDTLVTLADGTQKEIQHVTYDDQLLVWNFYTGEYTTAPASIVMNHGYSNVNVVTLTFADGTTVNTINGHGFFDVATNEFVLLDENNADDYIGHEFVKQNGDVYATTTLVEVGIEECYTEVWSILTAEHYNCIMEGMWTITAAEVDDSPEWLMPYEIGEDMKYDEAAMQADIEKYGLYTYEDFADYCTYEQFVAFGFENFKVSVGKGYITRDEILNLIGIHIG